MIKEKGNHPHSNKPIGHGLLLGITLTVVLPEVNEGAAITDVPHCLPKKYLNGFLSMTSAVNLWNSRELALTNLQEEYPEVLNVVNSLFVFVDDCGNALFKVDSAFGRVT